MSSRGTSWLAWSLVGLAVAMLAGGISLALVARPFGAQLTYESEADPFSVIVSLVTLLTFSVVGAIIASRQPRNAIGWIFCSIGLVVSLNSLTGGYAEYRLAGGPLREAHHAKVEGAGRERPVRAQIRQRMPARERPQR